MADKKADSDYFVLHLSQVTDAAEEWLSHAAFENGALGMSEPLAFDQPEGEETVFTRIPDTRNVDVYFAVAPEPDFVRDLRSRFPQVHIDLRSEPTKDWLEEWKKGFKPFALVDGHWVVPSWCEPPPEAQHKIWIDPGMAFGTGTHETTQLVAEALKEVLPSAREAKSFLDVGTGTGILAILAKQMGLTDVYATEIEDDARRVARENFARNGCDDITMNATQVEELPRRFDLVAANIIDGVLLRLQEVLKARVKPGGWLILSGIILERERDFLSGFRLPGEKKWDLRRQKGDWLLYAAKL
jgi:ribosomal protein L11 methyltransferase